MSSMSGMILDSHDRKMALQELDEARNEMLEKLSEIKELIRNLCEKDRMILKRAESYWLTSIENNLSADSRDFVGSMVNFQNTFDELKSHVEECDAGAYDGMEDSNER